MQAGVIQINMMIGIQGSGKSTYVQKNPGYCFSADEYRKNFPDEDNEKIFTRLYKDLDKTVGDIYLNNIPYRPIYLDNTNMTIKERKETFRRIERWKKSFVGLIFKVTAIVMATPFDLCLERVKEREKATGKVIPEEVVYKYRARFNIPIYEEGFSEIKIINGITLEEITEVKCNDNKYATMMYRMINFDQENPHHKYTLGVHMAVCQGLVLKGEKKFHNRKCMYVASIVHDWGKYYTKSYNANGIGIYYNHGEVGTYELLADLSLIPQKDFTMNEILRVLAYVNYHMRPFDWNTKKALEKAYETYGGPLTEDLIEFNKIDIEACGTESEQITG